jgi:threonine aldolase
MTFVGKKRAFKRRVHFLPFAFCGGNMPSMTRRELMSACAGAMAAGPFVTGATRGLRGMKAPETSTVILRGDGTSLSPMEYSALLSELTANGSIEADYYSIGGAVEAMEHLFAEALGKERAVFFPTGTLANQIAIRALAGGRRRVIVQAESHIYNDSGDCLQTLSNINLIPLAPGCATFTIDEVEGAIGRASRGRVKTEIGAISIENPVRLRLGEVFDFEEMKKIAALAKERGIGMHLDGARLFIASAYTGIPVTDYSALFDTVYISLWKYFNAASGAVLAGPAALLDEIYHTRRMFGGGLAQVWPFAVVAAHYLDGFMERFGKAIAAFETLIGYLQNAGFKIERIPNGTSNCKLLWDKAISREEFRERLAKKGVYLYEPAAYFDGFVLTCNETITRTEPSSLAQLFVEAAS